MSVLCQRCGHLQTADLQRPQSLDGLLGHLLEVSKPVAGWNNVAKIVLDTMEDTPLIFLHL